MKNFYELTVEEALGAIERNEVEYFRENRWHQCFDTVIKSYVTYRLKPEEQNCNGKCSTCGCL